MLLPDREILFRISSEAYEKSSGDIGMFEHLVRSDIRVRGLSFMAIGIIVALAKILFKIWLVSGVHRPSLERDPRFPAEFEQVYASAKYQEESDHD